MIRVNLSRKEIGKGQKTMQAELAKLIQPFEKYLPKKNPGAPKIQFNARALVVLVFAALLGGVPHLLYVQFRTFVDDEHAQNKKKLEQQIQTLDSEIVKFSSYQKELESYEKQKGLVNTRLQTVKQLLSSRGTPVAMLDALAQSLPKKGWITDLDIDLNSQTVPIKLAGQAYSNEEVSDFLDKLNESVYFSDVKLEDVGASSVANSIEVKTFRFTLKPKNWTGQRTPAARQEAPKAPPSKPPPAPPPGEAKKEE